MTEEKQFFKLMDLVKATPEIKWNYAELGINKNIYPEDVQNCEDLLDFGLISNPNFSFEYIYNNFLRDYSKKNLSKNYNWFHLSQKANLDEIFQYPDLPWWWKEIITQKIIDINVVKNHLNFKWDWYILSQNIPIEQILTNPELPWDKGINKNKFIDINFVKSHPEFKWDWDELSGTLPIDQIDSNPEFKWDYFYISENKTLTSEYVLSHMDKNWSWENIFDNPNIDYNILTESKVDLSDKMNDSINGEIHYDKLFKNISSSFIKKYKDIFLSNEPIFNTFHMLGIITLQDIEKDPDLIVDYQYFSENPNLTIDYVINNKDEPWDLRRLSRNKVFKMKDIIKGIEAGIEWSFWELSDNPNITFDFIYQNRNKDWCIGYLESNPFSEQRKISLEYFGLKEILIHDLRKIILEY